MRLAMILLGSVLILKGAPHQMLVCKATKVKHGVVTICLPPHQATRAHL
jgi:hypothetical protein